MANHQRALPQSNLRPHFIVASLLPVVPVARHATTRPLLFHLRLFFSLLLLSVAQCEFCLPVMPKIRLLSFCLLTRRTCALPLRFFPPPAKLCRTKVPRDRAGRPPRSESMARRLVATGQDRPRRAALRWELPVPPLHRGRSLNPQGRRTLSWKLRPLECAGGVLPSR